MDVQYNQDFDDNDRNSVILGQILSISQNNNNNNNINAADDGLTYAPSKNIDSQSGSSSSEDDPENNDNDINEPGQAVEAPVAPAFDYVNYSNDNFNVKNVVANKFDHDDKFNIDAGYAEGEEGGATAGDWSRENTLSTVGGNEGYTHTNTNTKFSV